MISLYFGDGEYDFRLGLAQINEIEAKCGNLGSVFARLLRGRYGLVGQETIGALNEAEWKIADLIEPIRQGLIGGGKGVVDGVEVKVDAKRANELVAAYILAPGKLEGAWTTSTAILTALIQGYQPPGEVKPPPRRQRKRKASSAKTDTQEPSQTAE